MGGGTWKHVLKAQGDMCVHKELVNAQAALLEACVAPDAACSLVEGHWLCRPTLSLQVDISLPLQHCLCDSSNRQD